MNGYSKITPNNEKSRNIGIKDQVEYQIKKEPPPAIPQLQRRERESHVSSSFSKKLIQTDLVHLTKVLHYESDSRRTSA